jgi:hypothetical protein
VLLNTFLYVGNNLCKYFVDLDAINLVFYITTIVGWGFLVIIDCRPRMVVFSEP